MDDAKARLKNKIDFLGAAGSLLAAGMCVGIGWSDWVEGHSWRIWVVMTLVLVINGGAMLLYAIKELQKARLKAQSNGVVRARS